MSTVTHTNTCSTDVSQSTGWSVTTTHIPQLCGAAWSSRWLMVELTNGQHTCELVFNPMVDILNMRCDYQFVFSVLDELYASHHIWCNRCCSKSEKSMKCDVLFSQGCIRTIGEVDSFSYMSNKFLPLYNSAKIIKIDRVFQSYDHKCTATFFMVHSVHFKLLKPVSSTSVEIVSSIAFQWHFQLNYN